ncbi:MAG: hypothetical protein MPJ24_09940 [Pirellulaceae bacterium]|nr:hypothetical protein [Pirellulaceae bacterium]
MKTLLAFVSAAFLSFPPIDYGWQPCSEDSSQLEYIVQLEPELIAALQEGQPVVSHIPEHLHSIKRVVVRVGNGPLPRQDLALTSHFGSSQLENSDFSTIAQEKKNQDSTLLQSSSATTPPATLPPSDLWNTGTTLKSSRIDNPQEPERYSNPGTSTFNTHSNTTTLSQSIPKTLTTQNTEIQKIESVSQNNSTFGNPNSTTPLWGNSGPVTFQEGHNPTEDEKNTIFNSDILNKTITNTTDPKNQTEKNPWENTIQNNSLGGTQEKANHILTNDLQTNPFGSKPFDSNPFTPKDNSETGTFGGDLPSDIFLAETRGKSENLPKATTQREKETSKKEPVGETSSIGSPWLFTLFVLLFVGSAVGNLFLGWALFSFYRRQEELINEYSLTGNIPAPRPESLHPRESQRAKEETTIQERSATEKETWKGNTPQEKSHKKMPLFDPNDYGKLNSNKYETEKEVEAYETDEYEIEEDDYKNGYYEYEDDDTQAA